MTALTNYANSYIFFLAFRKLLKSQRTQRSMLGARVHGQLPGPDCALQDDLCVWPCDEPGFHRLVSAIFIPISMSLILLEDGVAPVYSASPQTLSGYTLAFPGLQGI